jgi:hypothetical protein
MPQSIVMLCAVIVLAPKTRSAYGDSDLRLKSHTGVLLYFEIENPEGTYGFLRCLSSIDSIF